MKNHTHSLCKYYNKLLYLFKPIVHIISFISFHGILSLDYPYIIATSGYITNSTSVDDIPARSSFQRTDDAYPMTNCPRPTSSYSRLTKDRINRDIDQSSFCDICIHLFNRSQLHLRPTTSSDYLQHFEANVDIPPVNQKLNKLDIDQFSFCN